VQAYIDFEIEEAERERARHLYERLLERTSHVKVYISYALMEVSTLGGGEDEDGNEIEGEAGNDEMARGVFERGYKDLRARGEKEDVSDLLCDQSELTSQRALLLEAWKTFEEQYGTEAEKAHVQEMMPTTRKRWRKAADGSGALEEYWDIAFPDDEREANPTTFKFFQAAQNWAAQRTADVGGGLSYDMPSDSDDDDDDDEEEEKDEDEPEAEAGIEEAAVVGTTSTADEAMDETE
jgi:crooked neck